MRTVRNNSGIGALSAGASFFCALMGFALPSYASFTGGGSMSSNPVVLQNIGQGVSPSNPGKANDNIGRGIGNGVGPALPAGRQEDIQVTRYVYDGSECIEEATKDGKVLRSYVYSNRIDEVLQLKGRKQNEVFFYHANSIGSIAALTSGQGQVVELYKYDPFGQTKVLAPDGTPNNLSDNPVLAASVVGNPYMFTGRWFDPETGFYYYRARFYNPATGRFVSRDPKGFEEGMNLYEYVRHNPVNKVDPLGTQVEEPAEEEQGFGEAVIEELTPIGTAKDALRQFELAQEAETTGEAILRGTAGVTLTALAAVEAVPAAKVIIKGPKWAWGGIKLGWEVSKESFQWLFREGEKEVLEASVRKSGKEGLESAARGTPPTVDVRGVEEGLRKIKFVEE
jgi:RHS repeat-associated protein